ncbi:hypothetical protein MPTK1_1g27700 [Marchantia polymorpha subsp. ruderalis]|uniref:Uncharacterized protein n=2 Tax=Marchantia polymorpha TaxID=3197 RepID=A0AAF6AUY4_MARPO|nr:hypothetical protein MARPO_0002s0108 [Marchantia polymorpha]BBN00255.1 hypothetical protein Mp_1g27700 [Marchantia polymorpha subsp. ruderalis]|eukprot:PTQ49628.1 hypothetical protein MARPO_0002s0108 [Marchantia polymorpha]
MEAIFSTFSNFDFDNVNMKCDRGFTGENVFIRALFWKRCTIFHQIFELLSMSICNMEMERSLINHC